MLQLYGVILRPQINNNNNSNYNNGPNWRELVIGVRNSLSRLFQFNLGLLIFLRSKNVIDWLHTILCRGLDEILLQKLLLT